MLSIKLDMTKNIILHTVGWILLFLLPPFLFDNFERISTVAPEHYYLSCLLLIPIYYISRIYLLQKKSIIYIIVVIVCFIVYLYLPELIFKMLPQNDSLLDFIGSSGRHRLNRMRQGLSILFFVVLAINILEIAFQLRKSSQKVSIEKNKAELALLKSQIDPHFLFNSLNSIYYEAIEKTDLAPKAIMSLSNLMRYVLTDAKSEYVSLDQEISYIDGYLELQKLRLPYKTHLNFDLLIENRKVMIAPLLLIPFIENAFKYGVSSSSDTEISIKLRVEKNYLSFQVENSIFMNKGADGTQSGLDNVKKRLALIYPGKHDLRINHETNTYQIDLSITL